MMLPDLFGYAETPCSPVKGSANGTYVVDTTMCGIGAVTEPITLKIKDGIVKEISGDRDAARLRNLLQMKDENAVNIGEFALGTNHIIKDVRGDHMDKTILGGMHLAVGSSASSALHGDTQSDIHEDAISLNITVIADGTTLMKDGTLLI